MPSAFFLRTHTPRGKKFKQIALRMKISRHTVHEYVKKLYRHFEVSTRAELMVKCLSHPHSKHHDSPAKPRPAQD